jgi:hypothetical protein
MTFDEADQAGLHSRGLMLEYENRTYKLNLGTGDKIHVFTRSIYLFVLTIDESQLLFPAGVIIVAHQTKKHNFLALRLPDQGTPRTTLDFNDPRNPGNRLIDLI